MTTGRLPSHHSYMALGLLTLILSRCHELSIFASFLSLYSRQLIKKNKNNKTSKFEIHAMQNLRVIILQNLCSYTHSFSFLNYA